MNKLDHADFSGSLKNSIVACTARTIPNDICLINDNVIVPPGICKLIVRFRSSHQVLSSAPLQQYDLTASYTVNSPCRDYSCENSSAVVNQWEN